MRLFFNKRRGRRFPFVGMLLLASLRMLAAEPVIDCVEVKTRSKENAIVKVWYRVPRNYDANGRELSRVLILFGGRNCDGKPEVSGKLGWTEWADLNGIFLVAPTLKNDNYWEPEKWSGRAMQDARADRREVPHREFGASLLRLFGGKSGEQPFPGVEARSLPRIRKPCLRRLPHAHGQDEKCPWARHVR